MSLCEKCDKPVYFAERKTSLGKDWHRECLRCAECGKVLHPGQHAQHKGTPYCHVPCYSALFGPTMFGHGSAVEAHNNFGMQAAKMSSPVRKPDLQARLRLYNEHYDAANLQIRSKEVNGRLVLEGPLRIHWGVRKPIQLAERDESPASRDEWRRSYCLAMANGLDDDFLQRLEKSRASGFTESPQKLGDGAETMRPSRTEIDELTGGGDTSQNSHSAPGSPSKSNLQKSNTVVIRGNSGKRRSRRKRMSIINGHIFNVDTSVFTPAHGSITNVTVTSLDTVYDVIRQLLDKFKIENSPREFCLCVVKGSGETRVLKEPDCPLLQRVMLGPLEDNAKIFIMDDGNVTDIDEDVAHFVSLPDAVLQGFLIKLQIEEQHELKLLKERYRRQRYLLEDRLSEFSSTHL